MLRFGNSVNVSRKANMSVVQGRRGRSSRKIRRSGLRTYGRGSGSGADGPGKSSGTNDLFVTMSEFEGRLSDMKKGCAPHSMDEQ